MIDWGNLPKGSMASIYLPVAAPAIVALANRMYTVQNLAASDAHTLRCRAGGTTYIPVQQGLGPNYAGLFSVQLPSGIRHGQEFHIVVRQITSSFTKRAADPDRSLQRFVYGSFQISIPVSVKSEMLVPEERNLSVLKWIQQAIPATSRWYPVFQHYIVQLEGIVTAVGGDGSTVPATQSGTWFGMPGIGARAGKGPGGQISHSFTGKVDSIIYDHFGDFAGFVLETFDGDQRRFHSHEPAVLRLVQRSWRQRILLTVVVYSGNWEYPIEIVLHGVPPPLDS